MYNTNSATLNEFIEWGRIFKFLSGLNSKDSLIQVQILSVVFYTVWDEQTQRSVMLDGGSSSASEGSGIKKKFH